MTASLTAAVSQVVFLFGTLFVSHLTLTAILNASALFLVILTASMTAAVSHVVFPLGTLFVFHLILNACDLFHVILKAISTEILIKTAVLVAVLEILILV